MGKLWLGQLAKRVIEREFEDAEGPEAVRFSHREFGFVVHALEPVRWKSAFTPQQAEIIRAEVVRRIAQQEKSTAAREHRANRAKAERC